MAERWGLEFDRTGFTPVAGQVDCWYDESGVGIRLERFPPESSPPFPRDDPEQAAAFFEGCGRNEGGVMVWFRMGRIEDRHWAGGVFKYRSLKPGSLAMDYLGMLFVYCPDATWRIQLSATEHGTTGVREAVVAAMLGDRWKAALPAREPVVHTSVEEFFSAVRTSEVHLLPSDGPEYDGSFPDHPLTLVRRRFGALAGSLRIPGDRLAL